MYMMLYFEVTFYLSTLYTLTVYTGLVDSSILPLQQSSSSSEEPRDSSIEQMILQSDALMSQLNGFASERFTESGVNDVIRRPDSTVNRVIMWSKSKGNQKQSFERRPSPPPSPIKPTSQLGETGLPLPSVKLNQQIISTLVDLLRVNVNIFFNEMIHAANKDRMSSGNRGTRVPAIPSGTSVDDKSLDSKREEQEEKEAETIDPVTTVTEAGETIERRSVTNQSNSRDNSNNVTSVNGNSMSQVASETIGIGKGDIPQSVGKPTGLEPPRFDKPNQMIHNSISLVTSTTSIGSGSNGRLSDLLST